MSKSSFGVYYHLKRKSVIVLGVTSILPNLNGVLFCTEDRQGHQVECHEMKEKMLAGMSIDYDVTEEDIEYEKTWAEEHECEFVLIDGRSK